MSSTNLLNRLLCLLAILPSLLLLSPDTKAQIVHLYVGVNESGFPVYMDAYEYDAVYEKPEFPGDLLQFINSNRVYPSEAYKKGVQGKVQCWFIVNADGSVTNVSIRQSVNNCKDPLLCEEAIRIFSNMPRWLPGRDFDGIPVPVRVFQTVNFRK